MISEKMSRGMKINRRREVTNVVLTYNDGTVQVIPANTELCQAAESKIRDTDMAEEMTEYTQQSILNQAAISVLSQANEIPQQVLSLLG